MSTSDTATASAPTVPFRCDIDVAARGWDHDAWGGDFFPLDLPREWRLTFYANHFRSVLVPGRVLLRAEPSNLAEWHTDTHEEFRFFLEISVRLVERFRSGGLAALLRWLEPLVDRTAGLLLLGFARRREPAFAHWIEALGERFVVHTLTGREGVTLPVGFVVPALGNLHQCWYPGLKATGQGYPGCLGLVRGSPADLPGLRRQIEAFMAYAKQAERATLCFASCPPSLHAMQQSRILVELLGG